MPKPISVGTMVKRLEGLLGTKDANEWTTRFLTDVMRITNRGEDTRPLSDRQVEKVEELFSQHFGG